MSFKSLMLSSSLFLGVFLSSCGGSTSPEYKELKTNGKVHDAIVNEVDSVKGECTYEYVVDDKVYHGKCKQIADGDTLTLKQFILIVYLDRDPSISRRLKAK